MVKIFKKSKDKDVAAVMIYGKTTGDNKAYIDADCTIPYGTAALEEAFVNGALIVIGKEKFKPVSFKIAYGVGTINYIKPNGTIATSADIIAGLTSKKNS